MLLLLAPGVGMGGSGTATAISTHRRRIQPLIRCRKKKNGKK